MSSVYSPRINIYVYTYNNKKYSVRFTLDIFRHIIYLLYRYLYPIVRPIYTGTNFEVDFGQGLVILNCIYRGPKTETIIKKIICHIIIGTHKYINLLSTRKTCAQYPLLIGNCLYISK